jgi:hypothetical protein
MVKYEVVSGKPINAKPLLKSEGQARTLRVGSSSFCISADNSENAAEENSHVYVCFDVEKSIQSGSNIDI